MKRSALLGLTLLPLAACSGESHDTVDDPRAPADTVVYEEFAVLSLATEAYVVGNVGSVSLMGDSAVLVVDNMGSQILALDFDGNLLVQYAEPGDGPTEAAAPTYARQGSDGAIYALTRRTDSFVTYAPDGQWIDYKMVRLSRLNPWVGHISDDGTTAWDYRNVDGTFHYARFDLTADMNDEPEILWKAGSSGVAPRSYTASYEAGGVANTGEIPVANDAHLRLSAVGPNQTTAFYSAEDEGVRLRSRSGTQVLSVPMWAEENYDLSLALPYFELEGLTVADAPPSGRRRFIYTLSLPLDGALWIGLNSEPELRFASRPSANLRWDFSSDRLTYVVLPHGLSTVHPRFDIRGDLAVGVRLSEHGEPFLVLSRLSGARRVNRF